MGIVADIIIAVISAAAVVLMIIVKIRSKNKCSCCKNCGSCNDKKCGE